MQKLKTHWEKIATTLGYSKEEIDLPFLLKQLEHSSFEDLGMSEKTLLHELKNAVKEALAQLLEMREKEGKALSADIANRLKTITSHVQKIEQIAPKASEKQREKLHDRLKGIIEGIEEDERVIREIALYAEKADCTEEVVRLHSHIKQASQLLAKKGESIGRTFDFLIQEMLRETNTIASKSADLTVTQTTVLVKAELEKIREQVQNIE